MLNWPSAVTISTENINLNDLKKKIIQIHEKTQVVCTGSISHAGLGSFGCHNLIKYVMDRLGHAINTFYLAFRLCYSVNVSMSF